MMKHMMMVVIGALILPGAAIAQTAPAFPPAVLQFGPTTEVSTLNCANFRRTSESAWIAERFDKFGLGFVQNIVPPRTAIQLGGWIYNNVDLYSQLELQCGRGVPVIAKY